jgi:FdhD protein
MAIRTARRRILRIAVPSPAGPVPDGPASPSAGETVRTHRPDLLAAEEPLEIRVNGRPLAVTMRTPGDDIDLAAGFLATEGLVRSAAEIAAIKICQETHEHGPGEDGTGHRDEGDHQGADHQGADHQGADHQGADHQGGEHQGGEHQGGEHQGGEHQGGEHQGNVAEVTLADGAGIDDDRLRRNFLTTSACGVCGKASIDSIRVRARYDVAADTGHFSPDVLTLLPGRLRDAQRVFASTGGLHAAGAFSADGTLLVLREDVGRHNAVDKVVGWALREGRLPLAGCVLLVSGRASFELVQKAYVAGMPVVAAVSAPSSLAAELAEEAGMTLVGFLRGGSMNVYTGAGRLAES